MLYDPECDTFGAIINATPPRLKELGLYGPLAFEWRGGALRAVSMALVARALGARVGPDWGEWTRERVVASARAVARACGGGRGMRLREFMEQGLIGGDVDGHANVRDVELQAVPGAAVTQPVSDGPPSSGPVPRAVAARRAVRG